MEESHEVALCLLTGLFWFLCVQNEPEPAVRKSYQAVERDGEIIRVRDTVLLKSGPRKKSMPYVAKISALWEDPKTGTVPAECVCVLDREGWKRGRNGSRESCRLVRVPG